MIFTTAPQKDKSNLAMTHIVDNIDSENKHLDSPEFHDTNSSKIVLMINSFHKVFV